MNCNRSSRSIQHNRIFTFLFMFSLIALLYSCSYTGINKKVSIDERAKFRDVDFTDSTESLDSYSVIVLSDLHFPRCRKNDFMGKIKAIDFSIYGASAMVVALGDLADDGTYSQYSEYNDFAEELGDYLSAPVFSVPGNHDTYASSLYGANYLQAVYPTTFYRLRLHDVSWYFLDSADGTFGYNQIKVLDSLFSTDSNRKIICTHYPLYADTLFYRLSNYKEKANLIELCAKKDVLLYLCGHTHISYEHDFGSFRQLICGSLVGDEEEPSFIILSFDGDGNYEKFVIQL